MALLGAKARTLQTMKAADPTLTDADIVPKLVAYSSELSHSSVERAGLLGGVLLRALDTDGEHKLRGDTLRNAVDKDRADGLIPFFVVATLGTTSCCSFDRLDEIAEVANDVDIWVHVDAAYAGKPATGTANTSVLRGAAITKTTLQFPINLIGFKISTVVFIAINIRQTYYTSKILTNYF